MSKVVQPLRLIDFSVLFFVMFFKKLKYELITHAKPISLDSNVSLTLLILFFYFATVIWLFFFSTVQYQIFEIHHVKIYELPCTYITFQKKKSQFLFSETAGYIATQIRTNYQRVSNWTSDQILALYALKRLQILVCFICTCRS